MRYLFRRPARLMPLVILIFFSAPFAEAQDETGTITIHVRGAQNNRALVGAQVLVQGMGIQAPTGQDGTIRLEGIRPGTRTVEVRYLGYAPQQASVTLEAGRSSHVRFAMVVQPIRLAEVRVRARPSRLLRTGFYRRRGGGAGTFFTREEIQKLQPRTLSDLMRRVPGANVFTGRAGMGSANFRGGQMNCPVQFYIDGTMTHQFLIDEVRPEDVEGIEIYRGAASLPPEFNKGTAICGVIVIWTRDR
ncbi:hypothetical protein BH23GEM6_BH23GEM6_03170 [soil metagenome]